MSVNNSEDGEDDDEEEEFPADEFVQGALEREREKGKNSYCVQVKKDNYDFRLKHIFITMETFWADFDQRQNITCFSCSK